MRQADIVDISDMTSDEVSTLLRLDDMAYCAKRFTDEQIETLRRLPITPRVVRVFVSWRHLGVDDLLRQILESKLDGKGAAAAPATIKTATGNADDGEDTF